jgi:hypothetical protein
MENTRGRRRLGTAAFIFLTLTAMVPVFPAWATADADTSVPYIRDLWGESPSRADFRNEFTQWHENRRPYRDRLPHEPISSDQGYATYYEAAGQVGACGRTLTGTYAASRTLPCGALVSVRRGDRSVFVTILDRGPFGDMDRIIDLSPRAFGLVGDLSEGVIPVTVVWVRR